MTIDKLIAEMDKALQFPGVTNAWTMPIKARIDMLSTGIRTPVGVKVSAPTRRDRKARAPDRGGGAHGARHDERLRRARDRRLLPRHRARPRRARPLRPDGRRRAGRDRHGARRRGGDHDGRGPRALHRQRPLSARLPQRSAGDRDAGAGPAAEGGTVPLGQVAKVEPRARARHHPHRERPARGLHLRRHARPRHRRLRRRRAEGGRRRRSSSRPATTSPGAASSNTWSAPRRSCKSSCRSRC